MSTKFRGAQVPPNANSAMLNNLWAAGANVARYEIVGDINAVGAYDEAEYYKWVQWHLDNLKTFINDIADLKIVIDLHTPPGGMHLVPGKTGVYSMFDIRPECREWFKNAWVHIVQSTTQFENVLAFDLINEPHGNRKQIFQLMRNTIRRIRSYSDKPCVVSCPYGSPAHVKDFSVYDQRMLGPIWYTIHMYLPYVVTHQGIDGTGYPAGKTYPSGNYDRQRLKRDLTPFKNFLPHEIHYIGEFSISTFADEDSRVNYLRDLILIFEEWGFDWSVHAFGESPAWNLEAPPAVWQFMKSAWAKNG